MYLSLLNKFDVALFFIDCSFSQLYTEKFLNVHEKNQAESGGLLMLKSISIWVSHGKTPISCIFCSMKYKLLWQT